LLEQSDATVWINQYANERNWQSHYNGEGAELARSLSRAPDYLVLGVSTSGTIHGLSRRLKQAWPGMRIVAVDAVGSVLFGTRPQARELPGIGASRVPELLQVSEIDEVVHIDDYESAMACRELVSREGIFAGGSSGSVIAAIQRIVSSRRSEPARILTILPDRGERYLDSVYDDEWLARVASRHFMSQEAPTAGQSAERVG
jgi:cysteine synthase A